MNHLYEALAEDVIALIDRGIYRSGERLLGVRSLSRQFNVSLSTAQAAYRLLEDQGKIQARTRSGHYVAGKQRQTITEPGMANPPATPTPVTGQTLTRQILGATKDPFQINLGSSVPHPNLLPARILQQATAKVVRTHGKRCFNTEELLGNPQLRCQIARRMASLNCHVATDDIVITYGARDSVSLALKAVCQPGDVLAIASPTFYGLLQVIEWCGLQALEIPTHRRHGMSLDALQLAVDQWPVKACLLIANFNNPLGSCMLDDTKRALLTLLTSYGVPLIEDDVYGDLAFGPVRPS